MCFEEAYHLNTNEKWFGYFGKETTEIRHVNRTDQSAVLYLYGLDPTILIARDAHVLGREGMIFYFNSTFYFLSLSSKQGQIPGFDTRLERTSSGY